MSSSTRILGGRYEVGALIGRGGMADVHLGRDTRLGRQVAIKILRSDLARDQNFLGRFRREAQSAAGLNHPSIVAIFDSGEDAFDADSTSGQSATVPYIVMEYVDGHTLREQLTQRGPFEPLEATRVTEDILDALDYSHRMGIVHRDIKPANVMVTSRGVVKVMDYGIARAIADTAATMTSTQSVVGTAQYLSPEQAQGQVVDARSDLYSTGCLLFELLANRPPFTGDSPVAIAYQHVGEAPSPPSDYNDAVGGDLDAVTLHALTKDREARYQTAAEFRRDLENVRLGRAISDAAQGTAAIAGASATQTMPAPYASPGSPTVVQPAVPATGRSSASRPGAPATTGGTEAGGSVVGIGVGVAEREQEPQQRNGGKVALITVLVLALLALAGWGATALFKNQTPPPVAKISVPDLSGMREDVAARTLKTNRLEGNATKTASDTVDVGLVVGQETKPGTEVEVATTIEYTVSSGPDTVTVPDVARQTQAKARETLEKNGDFKVTKIVQENKAGFDKDAVTKTDPPAGETVAKGSDIQIYVATGSVQVPDVTGQAQDKARKTLEKDGNFTVAKVVKEDTADFDKDQVTKTDPAVGTDATKGSDITLYVASGNVEVPDNLVGQDFSVAAVRLSDLKLKVTRVETVSDRPSGEVLKVANAGRSVKLGSTIEVTVAAAPTTPPSTVTVTQPPPTPQPTDPPTTPPAP